MMTYEVGNVEIGIKKRFCDAPIPGGVPFFFFYHYKKSVVIEKSMSLQNTSIVLTQPWCANLVRRVRPGLSRAHGLFYRDATQRHTIAIERLCRTSIDWLRRNALPNYRDLEHYVATWNISCPGTLCRDVM